MKRICKRLSPYKTFAALSESQKEAVYGECDDPQVALGAKPMTPRMRKLWEVAKSKGGRRGIGNDSAELTGTHGGVRRGLAQARRGEGRPMRGCHEELAKKHGVALK
jgi:hypothetical protein